MFDTASFMILTFLGLCLLQEDEATLIGVGAALGALSGLAQVPFY